MRALYWEQVDKIMKRMDAKTGEITEVEITREVRSDHPMVKDIWFTGSLSDEPLITGEIRLTMNITAVDNLVPGVEGFMKRAQFDVTPDQYESLDIIDAVIWINNLKPEE